MDYVNVLLFFLMIGVLSACGEAPDVKKQKPNSSNQEVVKPKFELNIIDLTSGFGYDILKNGKPFIRQKAIPVMGGNKSFSKKEDAEKIGKLVVEKLENGIIPPSLTKDEVEKLLSL